jgi:hypothetical protein
MLLICKPRITGDHCNATMGLDLRSLDRQWSSLICGSPPHQFQIRTDLNDISCKIPIFDINSKLPGQLPANPLEADFCSEYLSSRAGFTTEILIEELFQMGLPQVDHWKRGDRVCLSCLEGLIKRCLREWWFETKKASKLRNFDSSGSSVDASVNRAKLRRKRRLLVSFLNYYLYYAVLNTSARYGQDCNTQCRTRHAGSLNVRLDFLYGCALFSSHLIPLLIASLSVYRKASSCTECGLKNIMKLRTVTKPMDSRSGLESYVGI